MSQQPHESERTIEEEADDLRRRLPRSGERSNDALTDEDARTSDRAPSEDEEQ